MSLFTNSIFSNNNNKKFKLLTQLAKMCLKCVLDPLLNLHQLAIKLQFEKKKKKRNNLLLFINTKTTVSCHFYEDTNALNVDFFTNFVSVNDVRFNVQSTYYSNVLL